MISSRKPKSSLILKKSKFDKIIEKDIKKKSSSKKTHKFGNGLEDEMRLCKSWRKLGICPDGDKCTYAHSLEDIKYYSP